MVIVLLLLLIVGANGGPVACFACCTTSCTAAGLGIPPFIAACIPVCLAQIGAVPNPLCIAVCAAPTP